MILASDARRGSLHREGRHMRRWLDRVKGDIKENGLSGEEVYDQATWRCK